MKEDKKSPTELIYEYLTENNYWGGWENDKVCQDSIIDFLKTTAFEKKVDSAIAVIKNIIEQNKKHQLPNTLLKVFDVEKSIFSLLPGSRDHVVHSLNTYLLGLWLQSKLKLNIDDFPFQWMLTALFHDIGYPIDLANKIIGETILTPIDSLRVELGVRKGKKYNTQINYLSLSRLSPSLNKVGQRKTCAFNFIQECFDEWGLEIQAKDYYHLTVSQ
jgi:hypothetical protein